MGVEVEAADTVGVGVVVEEESTPPKRHARGSVHWPVTDAKKLLLLPIKAGKVIIARERIIPPRARKDHKESRCFMKRVIYQSIIPDI